MSTVLQQKCPNCGGSVEFDVGAQRLKCPFCDAEFDINAFQQPENNGAGQGDSINWNSQSSQWALGETNGMSVYGCQSCGGEIVADENTGATSCPYCGNQVVMKGQFSGALRPDLVIPFKLDKKAAKEALKKHYQGKKFVPKGFFDDNKLEEIKGVYVPHWLFTCDAVADASYKARIVREWSDEDYDYTETSHYDVYRSCNISFDNVPVDGSSKMPDDLMESIEPFDISQAVDFNVAYLAGYLADKYDVSVDDCVERANERIKQSADNALAATVTGYDSFDTTCVEMNVASGIYKYALYPVWLLTTKWEGKQYTFAMNGQTGKFVGNIPTDKKAVTKASLLLGAGIGAVLYGLAWLIQLL
ncbi:MAG: hypothetical protein J6J45_05735 [Clostridia bacterium]|nr:hypothetical protein [Clostridia bacterium]